MYGKSWIYSLSAPALLTCVMVLLGISFGAGYLTAQHLPSHSIPIASGNNEPADVDFSPVWKAWNLIDENFVPAAVASTSPIASSTAQQNQDKVWGLISGLAASLNDPYTFFLPPVENKQFTSDMSGSFEGVGMEIDVKDGVLTVTSPLKGSPAEAAGVKAGDKILKIDEQSTTGLDTAAAVDKIRGPAGTVVTLTMLRTGWSGPKEIKLTRQVITVPVVTTKKLANGIFVLSLAEFTANSPDLFRNGLREFVQSGDEHVLHQEACSGRLRGAVRLLSFLSAKRKPSRPAGAVFGYRRG